MKKISPCRWFCFLFGYFCHLLLHKLEYKLWVISKMSFKCLFEECQKHVTKVSYLNWKVKKNMWNFFTKHHKYPLLLRNYIHTVPWTVPYKPILIKSYIYQIHIIYSEALGFYHCKLIWGSDGNFNNHCLPI